MSVDVASGRGQRVWIVAQELVAGTVLGLGLGLGLDWEEAVVHVVVGPVSGMCFDLRCWCCWGFVVIGAVVRVWGRLVLLVAVAVVVVVLAPRLIGRFELWPEPAFCLGIELWQRRHADTDSGYRFCSFP